jgi:hypothetical protein
VAPQININYKAEAESQIMKPVKLLKIGEEHHSKVQRLQALGDVGACTD